MAEKPHPVRREITPRWKLVERKVIVREPDDDFEDELAPAIASFVADVGQRQPEAPDARRVLDRVRHIIRHIPGAGPHAEQRIILEGRSKPPYFGVSTAEAPNEHREEPA